MKKVALLVGVEAYQDDQITPLKFAGADVKALAQELRARCGFSDVRVLAEGEGGELPDKWHVLNALRDLAGELRHEDLFFFFFSGHGVEVEGQSYLLTRDSSQAFPEDTGLSMNLLRKNFERLGAGKRVLLMDACRNDPRAGKGESDNCMTDILCKDIRATARAAPTAGGEPATALLSACKPGQRAYEWSSKKHGVFTHFLLEGMAGPAWDKDVLEFPRLAGYAQREVSRWSRSTPGIGIPQDPWYEQFGVADPIVLATRAQPSAAAVAAKSIGPSAEQLAREAEEREAEEEKKREAKAKKRREREAKAKRDREERQRHEEQQAKAEQERQRKLRDQKAKQEKELEERQRKERESKAHQETLEKLRKAAEKEEQERQRKQRQAGEDRVALDSLRKEAEQDKQRRQQKQDQKPPDLFPNSFIKSKDLSDYLINDNPGYVLPNPGNYYIQPLSAKVAELKQHMARLEFVEAQALADQILAESPVNLDALKAKSDIEKMLKTYNATNLLKDLGAGAIKPASGGTVTPTGPVAAKDPVKVSPPPPTTAKPAAAAPPKKGVGQLILIALLVWFGWYLWHRNRADSLKVFTGHTEAVQGVSFVSDTIAVSVGDTTVRWWDLNTGNGFQKNSTQSPVTCVAATSADASGGGRLLIGEINGTISLLDATTGREINHTTPPRHNNLPPAPALGSWGGYDWIEGLAITKDGTTGFTGARDHSLDLWNEEIGAHLRRLPTDRNESSVHYSLAFSADGTRALSVSGSRGNDKDDVEIWNVATGERMGGFTTPEGVLCAAMTPDGKRVVTAHASTGSSGQFFLRVSGADHANEIFKLNGHTTRIRCVAISPDGKYAVSGAGNESTSASHILDCALRVWDLESGKEVAQLKGHTQAVTAVAYSRDGKQIVSGSMDKTVRLWNAPD